MLSVTRDSHPTLYSTVFQVEQDAWNALITEMASHPLTSLSRHFVDWYSYVPFEG